MQKKKIRIQITFSGRDADDLAIEWLEHLAYCFHIKNAKITELKPDNYGYKRTRLNVKYY